MMQSLLTVKLVADCLKQSPVGEKTAYLLLLHDLMNFENYVTIQMLIYYHSYFLNEVVEGRSHFSLVLVREQIPGVLELAGISYY